MEPLILLRQLTVFVAEIVAGKISLHNLLTPFHCTA